ncbi:triphosphoribosyl-dephospho-CoA synthase [Methylobacillus rhizosphaerae]|uniref:Triphosphoribosyl-dephospho-CoA synthase n=1 Tax=Methylobacillus rhizosphaerae TaxID=551994 RepID=A0A238YLA6_9PROT|nr:triphosphoribosyl-dephospho-CoA synthase [Methylobacillus rhizosphaerae]SNR71189.1 triphosphoribosyl-dephospho-CoA synthase [Methylobacillus rhizosphaerae]
MNTLQISEAFRAACIAELTSLKPGNVHIFADGHGMVVQQFIHSAEAVAAVIAEPGLSVGQRILNAVEATWKVVDCNTNLGIVLLSAPLINAVLLPEAGALQQRVQQVLEQLDVQDAGLAFKAIARAAPGGLGKSDTHDVHDVPQVTLLQAMQAAQDRDRIAWQYTHGFEDIFGIGIKTYAEAMERWHNPAWATTVLYLTFLQHFPDSHIQRKYGLEQAEAVSRQAGEHLEALLSHENPKLYQRTLLSFDAELKVQKLNPGTSADLTVATLLACALQ